MSDTQPNESGHHITKGKAAAGGVVAVLIALLGAYAGNGEIVIPRPEPHPALVARLDAVEIRLGSVENKLDDPTLRQETIALQREVAALNSRLDILMRLDTRKLRDDPPSGNRR